MRLYTPDGLLYPITVTRLLCEKDTQIDQHTPLFGYEYKHKVIEGTVDNKEGELIERTWPATFESELEGKLTSLDVHPGQVITRKTLVAEVEEACTHEVQFGGMCANCGKDMKETSYNTTLRATDRAKINTMHDRQTLLISQNEASRADEEARRRLLGARKLTLVVDLDQCIIQIEIEPTVGKWMEDPSNPNYESLRDVTVFKIPHDPKNYYLKLRPGLVEFLETMSQFYEMHIYTMATREYAERVSARVDPKGKIFAGRILSRTESGDEDKKKLKRLFPVDTRMVAIIDDRADVWEYIPNLVRVKPFVFFPGTGDINSSFLPRQFPRKTPTLHVGPDGRKKPGPWIDDGWSPPVSPTPPVTPASPTVPNGGISVVDRMVAMSGKQDDEMSMEEKETEHDRILNSQLEDRPLLQKQKILDAANEEAATSPAVEAAAEILAENGTGPSTSESKDAAPEHPKYRPNLLADGDKGLVSVEKHLRRIHTAYYEAYDAMLLDATETGRVAELRPGKPTPKRSLLDDIRNIPDVGAITTPWRSQVLRGCSLVFSGIVPLGVDPQKNDDLRMARLFGATVTENITSKTTHLIASPDRRTQKVRQAARKGLWIVSVEWFRACWETWTQVDEKDYTIHGGIGVEANGGSELPSFEDKQDGDEGLSDSDLDAAGTEPEPEGDAVDGTLRIQTGGDADPELAAELEKYSPTMDREDSSPTVTENPEEWEGINDELAEFLGSDAEDDGSDSEGSVRSESSSASSTPKGEKRKRDAAGESEGEEESKVNGEEGSRLQKRKKEALGRSSSLNKMAAVGEKVDGAVAVEEEVKEVAGDEPEPVGAEEDEEEDLEAQLMAEMAAQEEEDREDGG